MLYVNPLEGGGRAMGLPNSPERRQMALQELEHYFVFTLLQEMRKSIPEDKLLGHNSERAIYNEMLDDAFAGSMAKSGQLGIAKQIENQLRQTELQRVEQVERADLKALVDEGLSFKYDPRSADNSIRK